MRVRSSAAALLLVVSTLGISSATTPAFAQESSPTPAATDGRDLYLDMPYTLGGFDTKVVMARGEEHFANLEPGDQADDQTRADLERLLAEVGAGIDDMVSGYALVSQDDYFSFVVAIRIRGIEPGTLLPAYLPILERGFQDVTTSDVTIGDKSVLKVTSLGAEGAYADVFVYDAGDTLWMVQGPDDVVETVLSDLP